jgi:hypothetical protein
MSQDIKPNVTSEVMFPSSLVNNIGPDRADSCIKIMVNPDSRMHDEVKLRELVPLLYRPQGTSSRCDMLSIMYRRTYYS